MFAYSSYRMTWQCALLLRDGEQKVFKEGSFTVLHNYSGTFWPSLPILLSIGHVDTCACKWLSDGCWITLGVDDPITCFKMFLHTEEGMHSLTKARVWVKFGCWTGRLQFLGLPVALPATPASNGNAWRHCKLPVLWHWNIRGRQLHGWEGSLVSHGNWTYCPVMLWTIGMPLCMFEYTIV